MIKKCDKYWPMFAFLIEMLNSSINRTHPETTNQADFLRACDRLELWHKCNAAQNWASACKGGWRRVKACSSTHKRDQFEGMWITTERKLRCCVFRERSKQRRRKLILCAQHDLSLLRLSYSLWENIFCSQCSWYARKMHFCVSQCSCRKKAQI